MNKGSWKWCQGGASPSPREVFDAVNFTNGNPSADPTQEFVTLYTIGQMSTLDRYTATFTLNLPVETDDALVPARLIIANVCSWEFRGGWLRLRRFCCYGPIWEPYNRYGKVWLPWQIERLQGTLRQNGCSTLWWIPFSGSGGLMERCGVVLRDGLEVEYGNLVSRVQRICVGLSGLQ